MAFKYNKESLKKKAQWVRQTVVDMSVKAKSGHVTTAFSQAEMLVALYQGKILRLRPNEPKWPDRDRFILSKGQGGIGTYPILADMGFFPQEELEKFTQEGSHLGVHAEWNIPGVELLTGSLGHGLAHGHRHGVGRAGKRQKTSDRLHAGRRRNVRRFELGSHVVCRRIITWTTWYASWIATSNPH